MPIAIGEKFDFPAKRRTASLPMNDEQRACDRPVCRFNPLLLDAPKEPPATQDNRGQFDEHLSLHLAGLLRASESYDGGWIRRGYRLTREDLGLVSIDVKDQWRRDLDDNSMRQTFAIVSPHESAVRSLPLPEARRLLFGVLQRQENSFVLRGSASAALDTPVYMD